MMKSHGNGKAWKPAAYRKYKWIVRDPDLLGGKLAIRGTRLSVAFVLGCLADGLTADEIAKTYAPVTPEAMREVTKVAAEA